MIFNKCPICTNGTLMITLKKKGKFKTNRPLEFKQLNVSCTICGDNIQKHVHSKENSKIKRDIYAQINGLLTSVEVRAIRKKLNLTQKEAARICGGGTNAFSRYERGEVSLLRSTSNLLRVLSRYPADVEYLLAYCI